MKKVNFVKAIEVYQSRVVKALTKRNVDIETAQDAVQDMIVSVLDNKAYDKLEYDAIDSRVFSYLKSAAKSSLAHIMRKQNTDSGVFVSVDTDTEKERNEKVDVREKVKDERECPFCHVGMLNLYRVGLKFPSITCSLCHTVLGQGKSEREQISVSEADLASLPNLEMNLDVFNAIQALEPLEQTLIKAIANGTDTLDDLADANGVARVTLWRTYVRAKKKLQQSLLSYS